MSDKIKIEFAPGCFDQFEGTQEELEELIQHILSMAESGELLENSEEVDFDELDEEELEIIQSFQTRNLQ